MTILVSACLLGLRCRYDGQSKPSAAVLALGEKHSLVPCCPEQLGGLPTPRSPAEWQGDRIANRAGEDVTAQYLRGGEEAVNHICCHKRAVPFMVRGKSRLPFEKD